MCCNLKRWRNCAVVGTIFGIQSPQRIFNELCSRPWLNTLKKKLFLSLFHRRQQHNDVVGHHRLVGHPPPPLQHRVRLSRISGRRGNPTGNVPVEGSRSNYIFRRIVRFFEREILPRFEELLRIRPNFFDIRWNKFIGRNFYPVLCSWSSISWVKKFAI